MLLILSSTFKKQSAYKTLKKISQKLSKQKIHNTVTYFDDVIVDMRQNNLTIVANNTDIKKFSAIYFRKIGNHKDITFSICTFAKKHDIKFIDHFHINPSSLSKSNQYTIFSQNNIPFPHTINAGSWNNVSISYALKKMRTPIVIKQLFTSQGHGVDIAQNEKELKEKISHLEVNDKQFVLQEFIDNSYEYRILVLGGKAAVAEIKTRQKDEWRNNVSLGADEDFVPIDSVPKNIISIAERAAKSLCVDIAGVDICIENTTNSPYVLEVNTSPQFTLDENISDELLSITNYISLWLHEKK